MKVVIRKGSKVWLWIQGQTRPLHCRVEEVDEKGWPQVVEVLTSGDRMQGRRMKRERVRWAVVVHEDDLVAEATR